MRPPWRGSGRRRVAWFALIVAVALAHALFALRVRAGLVGWNMAPEPRRIEIRFDRALQPSAPAPVAAAPAPAPRLPHAARKPRAASAPLPASAPAPQPPSHDDLAARALALADEREAADRAAEAASAASAADAAAQAAASAVPAPGVAAASAPAAAGSAALAASTALPGPQRRPFAWPPSTRLTYTLTGLYRGGPLYGKATIEWRRSGAHYQVQFDIHVSPFFDQHMFSDGQIGEDGLGPQHYDETFEVPFMAPRVRRMAFTETEVVLPNGNHVIRFPRTQDQASQFVQLVWMFATRPELLRPGARVAFPLALNTGVRPWTYRVEGAETLSLPFGHVDTVHLKPLRDGPRHPNEYPFEFWTAPALQYLPVRVLVPIDDGNFADLTLDALPLQAAPADDGEAASQAMLR